LGGGIVDEQRSVCEAVDVLDFGGVAGPAAELRPGQDVAQLAEELWADDQVKASLRPGREDLARRSGGRDRVASSASTWPRCP